MEQPKKIPLSAMYLALLLFLGAKEAVAQTAQEIAKKAFGSTVLLVMEDANDHHLSFGSGFFVREGEIASNLHVVKGAAKGFAKLVGEKTKYDIEGITAVDPKRDLVVLKISARRWPALPIGNSDAVQVGESVYAVGNPQGFEGTFSQGIISSIREVGNDKLLQITAPISPGSSGGPVLSGKGEVIGISVAFFSGGQNLNFAIPSNYLKTLIATAGPARPLAQAKLSGPSARQQELSVLEEQERLTEERTKQSDLDRNIEEQKKGLEGKKKKSEQAKVMPYDTPRQTGREITGRDRAPMALVPEGEFLYGNDKRRLKLKAFYMDKYEVSTSRYAKFLDFTASEKPTDWEQTTPVKYGDRPVVGVDWTDASGYCKWAGKRLPTEEEWEKAARGTDGRTYPWGEEAPTRLHANFGRSTGSSYANLVSVDQLVDGKSPYGMYNMAGNVWEWTSSDYLFPPETALPLLDKFLKLSRPLNPAFSDEELTQVWRAYYSDRGMKVLRGGSWEHTNDRGSLTDDLQSSSRKGLARDTRNIIPHGFRCAQDASQ